MRTTVTLDSEQVNELLRVTKAKSKAKAVEMALQKFISDTRWNWLKAQCGTLKFHPLTAEWRHLARR